MWRKEWNNLLLYQQCYDIKGVGVFSHLGVLLRLSLSVIFIILVQISAIRSKKNIQILTIS